MALGRQVVNFFRLDFPNQSGERTGVAQISIMKEQPGAPRMRIVVNRVQASRIECAGSANDAMDFVALRQQQFRQIRPVLSGDPRNERYFGHALARRSLRPSIVSDETRRFRYSEGPGQKPLRL